MQGVDRSVVTECEDRDFESEMMRSYTIKTAFNTLYTHSGEQFPQINHVIVASCMYQVHSRASFTSQTKQITNREITSVHNTSTPALHSSPREPAPSEPDVGHPDLLTFGSWAPKVSDSAHIFLGCMRV